MDQRVQVFEHKPRTVHTLQTSIRLNGMDIRIAPDCSISINISDHAARLDLIPTKCDQMHEYVTARANRGYILMFNRPYLAF